MTERERIVRERIAHLLAERDEYNWEFYTDNESHASKDKEIREILEKYRGSADAILNLIDSEGNKLLQITKMAMASNTALPLTIPWNA